MNIKLYLWNNFHNGDIITTIPLIWEIHKQIENVTISVGCFNNHSYLFEGCPIKELFVANNNDGEANSERYNFSSMCPKDYYDIYTWLGQYHDTRAHTWENQVEVFNRKCCEKNISIKLHNHGVPDITFPKRKIDVPNYPKSVWVENGICRSGHSEFFYNMDKIGKLFPDMHFYTTAPSQCNNSNVTDCSRLNLIELSNLSNDCDIILGKGSGPYFTTFTNENRGKPRAVVGYNLRTSLPFWNNPNSIIKYLSDESDLINFLKQ
jgi:hypothetical protein